jgi:hypothetical protein
MALTLLFLLLHVISARTSKQSLMVHTFLKVYMELCSYFASARTSKRHHHHPILSYSAQLVSQPGNGNPTPPPQGDCGGRRRGRTTGGQDWPQANADALWSSIKKDSGDEDWMELDWTRQLKSS